MNGLGKVKRLSLCAWKCTKFSHFLYEVRFQERFLRRWTICLRCLKKKRNPALPEARIHVHAIALHTGPPSRFSKQLGFRQLRVRVVSRWIVLQHKFAVAQLPNGSLIAQLVGQCAARSHGHGFGNLSNFDLFFFLCFLATSITLCDEHSNINFSRVCGPYI